MYYWEIEYLFKINRYYKSYQLHLYLDHHIMQYLYKASRAGKPWASSTEYVFKIEAATDIPVNVWTDMQSACGIQTVWYSIILNALFDNILKTVAMLWFSMVKKFHCQWLSTLYGSYFPKDLTRIGHQTSSLFRTAVSQIIFSFYRKCSGLHRKKAGGKITAAVRNCSYFEYSDLRW